MSKFKPSYSDFAILYDDFMEGVPYHEWANHVERLFHLHRSRPKTILDCACGTGNLSWELAGRGYQLTGVDLSPGMIQKASSKFLQQSKHPNPPQFHHQDLSELSLPRTFEAATCLFDSLNYIIDSTKLQRAFLKIGKHLHPGALFIFDLNTPYSFESDLFTQTSELQKHQIFYDWQATFDRKTRLCSVKMTIIQSKPDGEEKRIYEEHLERAYEIHEIQAMLEQTGWKLLQVYDEYTLSPAKPRSKRWFFAAMKLG